MKSVLTVKKKLKKDDEEEPDTCPHCFQRVDVRATRCNHCCGGIERVQHLRNLPIVSENSDDIGLRRRATHADDLGELPPLPADDNDGGDVEVLVDERAESLQRHSHGRKRRQTRSRKRTDFLLDETSN